MVWKKDLARLKQELKEEGPAPSGKPAPKPAPKPAHSLDLNEEDALFLSVMGRRPEPPPSPVRPESLPLVQDTPPAKQSEIREDFEEAMTSLKGVKRSKSRLPALETRTPSSQSSAPPDKPLDASSVHRPDEQNSGLLQNSAIPPPEAEPVPLAASEPQRRRPALFQLAAGMAIEVDGVLDLRGHSRSDALERLKERVMDGSMLGWRTFHIIIGGSEALAEILTDFLTSPEANSIARYAQAPIPMGGTQAWILYYSSPRENP